MASDAYVPTPTPASVTESDRRAEQIRALLEAVVTGPGTTDPSLRSAASRGIGLPTVLETYIAKIRRDSHRITDRDVAQLRANGYSEDDIFEITIAAALGVAAEGLETALRVMKGTR